MRIKTAPWGRSLLYGYKVDQPSATDGIMYNPHHIMTSVVPAERIIGIIFNFGAPRGLT